jgi:hypothetical protein
MRRIKEVLRLKHFQGLPERAIARSVGVSNGVSDQFIIRMPGGMRDHLAKLAEEHGRSMNAEALEALERWIAKDLPGTGTPISQEGLDAISQRLEATAKALEELYFGVRDNPQQISDLAAWPKMASERPPAETGGPKSIVAFDAFTTCRCPAWWPPGWRSCTPSRA